MFDQHFLSSPSAAALADAFGPLQGGERKMWRGRCGVAEYAFEQAASLPHWTLPETTDVLITDHRVLYSYTAENGEQVRSGELRWLWPQHLRVQPGQVSRDRGRAATQIQLVCGGADGSFPALVFAGGDLTTVGDADRLANVIRQAVARFRVDNAGKLGLTTSQARMLSRLLIGPEFRNHQGGEGQTVSMLGAMLVSRPAAIVQAEIAAVAPVSPATSMPLAGVVELAGAAALPADDLTIDFDDADAGIAVIKARIAGLPLDASDATVDFDSLSVGLAGTVRAGGGPTVAGPGDFTVESRGDLTVALHVSRPATPSSSDSSSSGEGTRLITYRPGRAADAARALMAAKAEEATALSEPAQASRAADLAARVADLVAHSVSPERSQDDIATWELDPATLTRTPITSAPTTSGGAHRSPEPEPPRPGHAERRSTKAWQTDDVLLTRGETQGTTRHEGLELLRGETRRILGRHHDLIESSTGGPLPDPSDDPTRNLAERAEAIRRTAARMASNAARKRGFRRPDREPGITTQGNHQNP